MLRQSFFSFVAIAVLATIGLSVPPVLATKKPPLHPINLSTASAAELQPVPGIGPATADKFLKMRKSYGPFKRWTICARSRELVRSAWKKCANI